MDIQQTIPRLDRLPRSVELGREDGISSLTYVDQRELPQKLVFARATRWHTVVDAIKTLAVRGAPAIGVAGAAAVALWASNEAPGMSGAGAGGEDGAGAHSAGDRVGIYLAELDQMAATVIGARPTAVNLKWGVDQVHDLARSLIDRGASVLEVSESLFDEVKHLEAADEAVNRAIGAQGAGLLPQHARVLTHCNAGSLATVFYGTALGVVYAAAGQGKIARVYADETQPVGQGARLTVWELARAGIPTTLICDNMAASLMAQGGIDAVIVGADRIAANGDTANKIGTYGLAVLARHHSVPFYVAAPTSTVDRSLDTGAGIPIEERTAREVLPQPLDGVDVWNPAFDVTPASLITRIITEQGVFVPGGDHLFSL